MMIHTFRTFTIIVAISFFIFLNLSTPVLALDINNGAKIFDVNCAGCHPQGGNIIRRGKTLKQKALQKNKMDSLESITAIVTNGKNNMSAFQDKLTPQEIETVAGYVLKQAAKNWQ